MQILLQASAAGGGWQSFLPLIGIVIVFYIFFIRPQSKQKKETKNFIDELKKGDKVITIGGIHGRIVQVNESNLLLDIGGNTKVTIEKTSISLELSKALNTPKKDEK